MAVTFKKVNEGVFLLDVQGYVCPHPQIYTKKALEKLKIGETLELIFDNPSSGESISAMCKAEDNEMEDQENREWLMHHTGVYDNEDEPLASTRCGCGICRLSDRICQTA